MGYYILDLQRFLHPVPFQEERGGLFQVAVLVCVTGAVRRPCRDAGFHHTLVHPPKVPAQGTEWQPPTSAASLCPRVTAVSPLSRLLHRAAASNEV